MPMEIPKNRSNRPGRPLLQPLNVNQAQGHKSQEPTYGTSIFVKKEVLPSGEISPPVMYVCRMRFSKDSFKALKLDSCLAYKIPTEPS